MTRLATAFLAGFCRAAGWGVAMIAFAWAFPNITQQAQAFLDRMTVCLAIGLH